jgi:hypothetical protein
MRPIIRSRGIPPEKKELPEVGWEADGEDG